jgi:hypothetical protein
VPHIAQKGRGPGVIRSTQLVSLKASFGRPIAFTLASPSTAIDRRSDAPSLCSGGRMSPPSSSRVKCTDHACQRSLRIGFCTHASPITWPVMHAMDVAEIDHRTPRGHYG